MAALIIAIIKAIKGISDKAAYAQNQKTNNISDSGADLAGVFAKKDNSRYDQKFSSLSNAYANAVNSIAGTNSFNSSDISDATKYHSVLFSR